MTLHLLGIKIPFPRTATETVDLPPAPHDAFTLTRCRGGYVVHTFVSHSALSAFLRDHAAVMAHTEQR